MKINISTFVLLWIISSLYSQDVIFNFHQLTPDQGLSSTTNEFIYMDKSGAAWISSLDAVNRFDGKKVQAYKPTNSNLKGADNQSPFFENGKGEIWFTTLEAINCYKYKDGNQYFSSYCLGEGSDTLTGAPYAFHMEHGRFLWLRNNGKLYRFDTYNPDSKDLDPILEDFPAIRAVAVEDKGKVKRIISCFSNSKRHGYDVITFSDSTNYGGGHDKRRFLILKIIQEISH